VQTRYIWKPDWIGLADPLHRLSAIESALWRGHFLNKSGCGTCTVSGCQEDLCQPGYYCPEGSTSAQERECGGTGWYCPQGSGFPSTVSEGYYTVGLTESGTLLATSGNTHNRVAQIICERGNFCINGIKSKCPPGVYGSTEGLSSPTCTAPCPLAHYCPAGSTNGTTHRCPGGRFGGSLGLSSKACSGLCLPGFYCPEASISARQYQCATSPLSLGPPSASVGTTPVVRFDEVFCPIGSSVPLEVQTGYYSLGQNSSTRTYQAMCPPGAYCWLGVIRDCPAGTYGNTSGLSTAACSGRCARGYYCPPASTSPTEVTTI